MSEPSPKVSVVMITYNHENYIEQAVRSALMQETDFEYEIVVGEDCSTDRTREILSVLQKQHPDNVRLVLNPQNLGMIPNFVNVLSMAQGEYIALLEGDDYWTDKHKLLKQVHFLDANPDYVLVCTNAVGLQEATGKATGLITASVLPFDFDTAELIRRNPCATLTTVFRNSVINQFPAIYFTGSVGDRPLYILLSRHGKCRFLPDVTGVYRMHPDSCTRQWASSYPSRKNRMVQKIAFAEQWNEYLGGKYQAEVEAVRQEISTQLVVMALYHRDVKTALEYSFSADEDSISRWKLNAAVRFLKMIRRLADILGYNYKSVEKHC